MQQPGMPTTSPLMQPQAQSGALPMQQPGMPTTSPLMHPQAQSGALPMQQPGMPTTSPLMQPQGQLPAGQGGQTMGMQQPGGGGLPPQLQAMLQYHSPLAGLLGGGGGAPNIPPGLLNMQGTQAMQAQPTTMPRFS
jgi:hypothetical protein